MLLLNNIQTEDDKKEALSAMRRGQFFVQTAKRRKKTRDKTLELWKLFIDKNRTA